MSNLGDYVLDQIRCLYPRVKNTPVMLGINDLKNKIQIKFSVEGEETNLTFNDMYLASISPKLGRNLNSPREVFIKVLGSEIKEGFKTSLIEYKDTDYDDNINFNIPLTPEVIEDIRDTANNIFNDKANWPSKLTPSYLRDLGSPLFNYHLCKCLVLLLQEYSKTNNYIMPQDLYTALKYPDDFFNPKVLAEKYERAFVNSCPNLLEQLDGDK